MEFSKLIFVLVALIFVTETLGHSYLTNPITRSNQRQSNTGCRGPACLGPCDISRTQTSRAPIVIQRGASINAQWPRNNHAGGFIRFAWAKTADSDSHSAFDAGVDSVVCHEVGGCKPDSASDPNGGDSGPADGSRQPCQTTITVPKHLPDGLYTLQWAWYGGAFALGDYYSCVDYQISGGPTEAQKTAVFKGGDYSNPNSNVCKFFNTDRLHRCVNEPCNNPVYSLNTQRTGAAFGIGGTTPTPTPTPTPPSTPVTTGRQQQQVPATTGRRPAATTGRRPSSSSSSSSSTSTSSSSSNTPTPTPTSTCILGYMKCVSDNQFATCAQVSNSATGWSQTRDCPAGLRCNPTGNYIYCT